MSAFPPSPTVSSPGASSPALPARRANLLATIVATAFGVGYSPFAPGTAGSAVGLLLFWPLHRLPVVVQVAATAAVFLGGVVASSHVASHLGLEDPGLVVVDEVMGMWVSLLWLPFTAGTAVLAFFAFRVMDVIKPWPARQFEHLPGGWGIMTDDLMAGVYANLLVQVAWRVWAAA